MANLTEIVFILDRSGSMSGLESETIGSFNSLIEKQKRDTEGGRALVTTVLFDNVSETVYDRVPLESIEPMTDRQYYVRGSTALLDAIGSTVHHIAHIHKYARPEDVPDKTIVVITTDGMENASRLYSADRVKKMVEHEQEKYGWEFLFLGANIDAITVAGSFGIRAERAVRYENDAQGVACNFGAVSAAMCAMRSPGGMAPDSAAWKQSIEADYASRRKNRRGRK